VAATYPGSVRSFTTKVDVTGIVYAAHPNDLQEEVVAIESILGITPSLSTTPNAGGTFTATTTSFATVSARLANIETGIVADVHTQYVNKTNGTVTTASTASAVVRNIHVSTSTPTGGSDGDVWLKYT
jgi:hypothetical protein